MEGGQLTQAELGAGAVTDGNIDDAIAQRCNRRIRATGRRVGEGATNNLLGLGIQDGETPWPELVGQYAPCIVGSIVGTLSGVNYNCQILCIMDKETLRCCCLTILQRYDDE
jgi:hypothetical protein